MTEFGPAVTLRIALASGIAFLVAQLLDLAIFSKLRDRESRKVVGGADNFLFHSGDESSPETTVTPGQAAVLRAHPLFHPVPSPAEDR